MSVGHDAELIALSALMQVANWEACGTCQSFPATRAGACGYRVEGIAEGTEGEFQVLEPYALLCDRCNSSPIYSGSAPLIVGNVPYFGQSPREKPYAKAARRFARLLRGEAL